ncbi:hypothetical protein FZ934_01525 [Rhizobium grahamii]|uniref:Uncharacterized protein n=1 Tax=Rhizobium grahamii TaxID=1120045 RepID=A0A5Q0C041_9HYPH|nr:MULTISPECIES: hypothetical protein [Rhizobium]QFY59236.1 hypothetical protein FZ934_01525 [Rhizobium grahamii]QRM48239.1 hypothetical protein F3Y33_02355 [Rhizobium sp. BG6]
MITTLTILSLDQGRIYSPPPEPIADLTPFENDAAVAAAPEIKRRSVWSNTLRGVQTLGQLLSPTFGGGPFGKAH